MNLWKSLEGLVEVELTSAAAEGMLEELQKKNIIIYHFHSLSDLSSSFQLRRKDYPYVCSIAKKRGETLRLVGKKGLYWHLNGLLQRPVLLLGILLLLLLTWTIPGYVLFVEVTGNTRIPEKQILEAGQKCGISFGATRKAVRSEKVKNALLSEIPELQWAGVNTRGCVAVISVRERSQEKKTQPEHEVSSIVAQRDGIVLSCTVTKGTLVCTEGQAVQQGQLLISGYTDCGLSIQATAAQGEIYAMTERNVSVVAPLCCQFVTAEEHKLLSISLILGKKRINLWKDSGIWDSSCGRMYEEYYVTLPGGFRLPIALCVDISINRELTAGKLEETLSSLQAFAEDYLSDKMIGGRIVQSEEHFVSGDELAVLQADYVCTEMIGRVQAEKMGE